MGLKLSTIQGNAAATAVECDTLEDVASIITTSNWSCGIYRDAHRNLENFAEAQLYALDVDGGCPLEVAKTLFAPYAHIIATTRNHRKEKTLPSGVVLPACDRFRVVLVLERPITSNDESYAVFHALLKAYPFLDEACKDASRLFYPSNEIVSQEFEGRRVPVPNVAPKIAPVLRIVDAPPGMRGRLSSTTLRFLAEGAQPGSRHRMLVKALMDLKQNLYTQEEAEEKLKHLDLMDDAAWRTVADVYENRPVRHPPRAPAVESDESERSSIERWVRAWLDGNSVAATYNREVSIGKTSVPRSAVLRKLRLARVREGRAIQKEVLEDLFNEWLEERRHAHLDHVRRDLAGFDERGTDELKRWCAAVFGATYPPIYVEVLRHFVWQVKRKIFGLTVEFHMMPIFSGRQGSGKTTAIEKFLSAVGPLKSTPKNFNAVRDDREARTFIDNFVIFFDEMARAERTDVNEIKNVITSGVIEYRPMGTNERDKGTNNSVLIGATNQRVSDVMMDDTGARRFFELISADKCDWDVINAINYPLIWKCIAETERDSPARLHQTEIAQLQESTMRHRTTVEYYLEEIEAKPSADHWVDASELLRKFNDWVHTGKWNPTTLGKKLRSLGYERRRIKGRSEWSLFSPAFTSITNQTIKQEGDDDL